MAAELFPYVWETTCIDFQKCLLAIVLIEFGGKGFLLGKVAYKIRAAKSINTRYCKKILAFHLIENVEDNFFV